MGPYIDGYQIEYPAPPAAVAARTILYTPTVTVTPHKIEREVIPLHKFMSWGIGLALEPDRAIASLTGELHHAELLIVDEADRLKTAALEQLRDHHDRTGIAVALIGMPGLERRLARYPQLYSRIGFAHEYRPLSRDDLDVVLAHHWKARGLTTPDPDADAAIARITHGNFRLVQRLLDQISRLLDINGLDTITREVVDAAREVLVIGPG